MSNSDIVAGIYAAFGRGDIPAILDRLAPDVEWEYGQATTDVPWLQRRKGRDGAGEFFTTLSEMEFHRFEPRTLLENGSVVVALVDLDATVKATGRRFLEEDEVHIWRFDDQGRVAAFRHRADTYLQHQAFHGA